MAKDNRHHFLVVFFTGCAGLLLALSLIPTGANRDLLGAPGEYLSYFLYKGFGLWAWIFPLVFIRFAIGRYKDEDLIEPGLKLLGLILALVSLCAITRIWFPGYQMFSASQMREEIELGDG